MEEAPEKGKESSHSAHGNGMNEKIMGTLHEYLYTFMIICISLSSS
jgi:hypothetical protein